MSNPSSPPPRYLPTLTEVVAPTPVVPPAVSATSSTLSDAVLQKITPLVESTLREAAHAQLDSHLNDLLPTLQGSIEAAVQKALQQTLLQGMTELVASAPATRLSKESR